MADATHCDGPSCSNWQLNTSTDKKAYFRIVKVYKTKHFCSWPCLSEYVDNADPIDGPEGLD